jgi:TonB family protein
MITGPHGSRFAVLIAFAAIFIANVHSYAQDLQPQRGRKVVSRVAPLYPSLAHKLRLSGIVKVEAEVASDGIVEAVAVKGGHPVLAQSAIDAVRKWKWEPASHESRELVEVQFNQQ